MLTPQEVKSILSQMSGTIRLMASLIYGCGLRLQECLRLRIKDIDLFQNTLIVREGKGNKDRITILPERLKPELREHLQYVRKIYEKDRKDDIGGVYLSDALERKYPNAGKEWSWFRLFPSKSLSIDPRTPKVRRHHIYPASLQKAFKKGAFKAEIPKLVTIHTLRHSFATHLIERGYDLRVVHELLGRKSVQTPMIYTHVAGKNIFNAKSPQD